MQLRSAYWIPRGRQKVRSVIAKCSTCKLFDSSPFKLPPPPVLPSFRLDGSYAFANCGPDHLGPVWIRDIYKHSETHKAYIALFTCSTTRAVNLELQPTLEASHLLNALKRFFSRLGKPNKVVTDCHKTFRCKELKRFARNSGVS